MPVHSARTNPRRLYFSVLGPILVVACLVALLSAVSVKVLGAVRGYATGESAWSKSCNTAIFHLSHYAHSRSPDEFARFEQSLQAPLGSRRAREELFKDHPDKELIRQLFIQGGSHPDDIAGMIVLFQYFGSLPLFERSVQSWVKGDALIDRLRTLGVQLQRQVNEHADDLMIQVSLKQLRDLSEEFNQEEQRFRVALDDAGRFTEALLIGAILTAATILTWASLMLVRRSLNRQMQHERALAAATKRWEMAAEVAGLGLFEQNGQTERIALDAKAARLYGLGEQAVSTPRSDFDQAIRDTDRSKISSALAQAMQTGETIRDVHCVERADGTCRLVELIGRQDLNEQRGHPRMIGVVRDVTDQLAQAQLTAQRDAAEQVAMAQREFLSRLSHELRTPLNAILGFAQLLELDQITPLPTHQHQQVGMILSAGKQLLALIEDVLDLSKVESGEINMVLQSVDVTTLMHNSMAMVDSARQLLDVHFVDRMPTDPLWVLADPQRLQQVFMNLLSNSCKYNRPGGAVTIGVRIDQGSVVIDIGDEGPGLTPEECAQLFQPFRRVASTAGQIEGTGLGLYIVKQLVERMHGQVSVRSEKGHGSTFTIVLPWHTPTVPLHLPT